MSKKFSYKEFVYDDTELKDFMDDTPYSEGEAALLFLPEVKAAAEAVSKAGVTFQDQRCRVLSFVRAMYFLGIQRGAEAYRSFIIANYAGEAVPEPDAMPFALSETCAALFARDVSEINPADLKLFYDFIGI